MRILGIDPGYGLVGFGVVEKISHSKFEYVAHGTIKTDSKAEMPDRLVEIGTDMQTLLKKYKPDRVVIERLFFVKNVTTGMQVAEAKGVIIYECRKLGLPISEITPPQVKMALTGNGKATKTEVKKMVANFLNLPKLKGIDDAIDALAVGIAG